MTSQIAPRPIVLQPAPRRPRRILAAVDGRPGGSDAVALGAALAGLCDADLLLAAIEPDPHPLLPGADPRGGPCDETLQMLAAAGNRAGEPFRTTVHRGRSVARELEALVRIERRDLLVVGSSHRAVPGEVQVSRRTRALLHEIACPLAIAPAQLASTGPAIRRIAVGYDGGPHAAAALSLAAGLAREPGTTLTVCGVIDDRIPALGRPHVWVGEVMEAWQDVMADEEVVLRAAATRALEQLRVEGEVRVARGRPADALAELSAEVDLLIIGSRRWGAPARVILGGTGEALAHGARSPLLVVPRPTRAGVGLR